MNIQIFEMPLDFGASRHGSDMGPSAIRLAGLKQSLLDSNHTIEKYYSPIQLDSYDYQDVGDSNLRYLNPIVKACNQLAIAVEEAFDAGYFPLVLGGDHSIFLGTITGVAASAKKHNKRIGVLYVDAHGDFNTTETSPSGNIHGMPVAAACGYGHEKLRNLHFDGQKIDPKNICYIGCRDIDPKERTLMKEAGVTVFTMRDIDRSGFHNVIAQTKQFFADKHIDAIHFSFDMDVIDPSFAPGVGIEVPGGLSYREVLLLAEEMFDTGLVKSADFVEVNPVLDVRNKTALMAVELISSLLGKKIY